MSSAFSFVERRIAINVSDFVESGAFLGGEAGIWEGNFVGTKRVYRLEQ